MPEIGCVFKAALMVGGFGCRNGRSVTRREGPDVACAEADAHGRCNELLSAMKAAALPAFGVEDDPLSMPHSVMVKIECGGLLALSRLLSPGGGAGATIEDVAALVDRTLAGYGDARQLPYGDMVEGMVSHKLRRRAAP
jgi:hypothetical protein